MSGTVGTRAAKLRDNMTKRISQIISELQDSSHSASIAVADHLETVASNGKESATNAAMKEELRALRDAAADALAQFEPKSAATEDADTLDALESTLPMLEYFHEREGCPQTLRKVKQTIARIEAARAGETKMERGIARDVRDLSGNTPTPPLEELRITLEACEDLNAGGDIDDALGSLAEAERIAGIHREALEQAAFAIPTTHAAFETVRAAIALKL